MCEIPSNVLRAAEFAEVFDGFSIGSNGLTQLALGVDRDSALVAAVFDERDPAVLELVGRAIDEAGHREMGGLRLPHRAEAAWILPDGRMPYWRAEILDCELARG
jgi:signal transduction protein with GAF and PtsI domain